MGMDKRKLLIDTDPGIDDAYAILSAMLCDKFDILGILCVSGNKSLRIVTPNALRLVDLEKKDIPVCKGAWSCLKDLDKPLVGEISADCHGADGMGESGLPYTERCLVDTPSWDFMLEKIKEYPDEVELVAIGPLTNLAIAIEKDVETMKQLKSITIMGGTIEHRGNVTPYAEFNTWFDAEAAQMVIEKLGDSVDIRLVGLDATHNSVLSHDVFDFLAYEGGFRGELLERISRSYIKAYYFDSQILGGIIHDLYAMLSLIDPSIIEVEKEVKVKVICGGEHHGQFVECEDGKKITAVMKFDTKKLVRTFLNIMLTGKEEVIEKFLPVMVK